MVVAKVTVWGTTWVAIDAGEFEAEAIIVDSIVAVCTLVIESVTVSVADGAGAAEVELPPSTATTEYDCGCAALIASLTPGQTTGIADAALEKRAKIARHCD